MKSLNIQKHSNPSNENILLDPGIQDLISIRNDVILHIISRKLIDKIPVKDERREESVRQNLIARCAEMSMEGHTDLVIDLWNMIMTESKKLQEHISSVKEVLAAPMSLADSREKIDQIDRKILIAIREILTA